MAKKKNGGRTPKDEMVEILRAEIDSEIDSLRKRMVESEVRLATSTTQLSGDVRDLSSVIGPSR